MNLNVKGNFSSIICQDSRETLWFGPSGVLDRLDAGTDSFVHYRRDPGDTGMLSAIRSSEAVQNTTDILKTCQVVLSRDSYPEGHEGLPDRKVPR
jgi:hypothetical protein